MRFGRTLVAAVIGLGIAAGAARAEKPVIEDGKPFPAIAFPSLDGGTPMSIADFRGKKVLLHVFASW